MKHSYESPWIYDKTRRKTLHNETAYIYIKTSYISIWISGLPRCEFWLLTEVPLRKQTRQSWPSMSSAISTPPSSAHVTMTRRSWRCRNSVSHSSRFQHRIRTRRWVHMSLQRRHISVMPNLQIDYLCNNLFGKLIIKKCISSTLPTLCDRNPPVNGGFPLTKYLWSIKMIFIWLRHHVHGAWRGDVLANLMPQYKNVVWLTGVYHNLVESHLCHILFRTNDTDTTIQSQGQIYFIRIQKKSTQIN